MLLSPSRTSLINTQRSSRYDWYRTHRGKENRDIYGMDVVEIPTNMPVIRKDLDDAVYKTKKEKIWCGLRRHRGGARKGTAGSCRYNYHRDQ